MGIPNQIKGSIEALLNAVQDGKYEWDRLVLSVNTSQCHYNCRTKHNADAHLHKNTHPSE